MAETRKPEVEIVGARWHPLRDAYHFILRTPWWGVLSVIVGTFLGTNALFAVAYHVVGGVAGMRDGSLLEAFFFSVQTMGTIGYGAMHPVSTAANALMVVESTVGLVLTALATGIVFARFTRSTGQIVFSRKMVISPVNGVPTLTFRIGNDRASMVYAARVEVAIIRTERTAEGSVLYRLHDAKLVRPSSPALMRSFMVMHPIDEESPIWNVTPEQAVKDELEVLVTVVGTDDTSLQPVHARRNYACADIVWGARLADVLSELPDGRLRLDLGCFHDIVPTEPTASFPYPRARPDA